MDRFEVELVELDQVSVVPLDAGIQGRGELLDNVKT